MAKKINYRVLFKKALALVLVATFVMGLVSGAFATEAYADNSVQIVKTGGANPANGSLNSDGVSVSKTVSSTDDENYFDITLEVVTTEKIEEIYKAQDIAVVVVMDISNTMAGVFGNTTRYAAAMDAATNFIETFADYSKGTTATRKLGFVAFNTHAHEIFAMSSCASDKQATSLVKEMKTDTGKIINAAGYASSHDRFTNIEAGLKMANDMLKASKVDNRYIVFLSDGFPTTYVSKGYTGVDPYDADGSHLNNDKKGKPCTYGTSYSDRAADKAQKLAATIKKDGTTIFSIGVDVAGQSIAAYEKNDANNIKAGFSVIDCYKSGYIIKDGQFENWLKNSIGSGYYYKSTNTSGLKKAYENIFKEIREITENEVAASWVVNDAMNESQLEYIDFVHFYNKGGKAAGTSISGKAVENGENTAVFESNNDKIRWDLKNSGYITSKNGNTSTYTYTLSYRVRLANEKSDFVENNEYKTNGPTSLTYQIRTNNGLGKEKTIDFKIPSVKGYLGNLAFVKTDDDGDTLAGATFKLSHNKNCSVCGGKVSITAKTATSDKDGKVAFANIPSGHEYTLKETKAPEGYIASDEAFSVVVYYGNTDLKDSGGRAIKKIENRKIVVTTEPEVTTTEPEVTTTDPEVTTTEPEVTTTEPEVTTTEPEVTTTEPEVTTTEPEVTTTEPEVTTTEPEVTTTEPEVTTTEPEVTTTEPEVTTTEPEVTTTEPEVTTTEPEVTTTEPEVTTTEPEVTTTEPEVTTTEPEVTTTEPEVTTTEPEVTTTEPEVTTTEPEVTTTKKPEVTTGKKIGKVVTIVTTTVTEPKPEPEPEPEETTTVATEVTTVEITTVATEPEPVTEPEEITTVNVPEETEPEETTTETEITTTEELVEIVEEEVPLTDIPDEEVPKTGDTYVWFAMSAISGMGLIALSFFDKKKKENE